MALLVRCGTQGIRWARFQVARIILVRLANRKYRIQELERISARHSDTVPSELDQLREEAKEKYEAMAKERRDLMERLSKGSKRRKLGAFARAAGQYGAANPLGNINRIMNI